VSKAIDHIARQMEFLVTGVVARSTQAKTCCGHDRIVAKITDGVTFDNIRATIGSHQL